MPNYLLISVGAVILAYLIGSVSFGIIVSKLVGLSDPRTYGSQNPGATNVLRSGHKLAAVLTLIGDGLKGWFAVWLAFSLQLSELFIALVAVAVFLGHLWPIFFKFVGGKGVATAEGILLGFSIWLGLDIIATWAIVAFCFRYSSLAAMTSAAFAPVYTWFIFGFSHPFFAAVCVISTLVIFRHQQNIKNLLAGKESRFGFQRTEDR